jgi:hypothetical protein
MKLWCGTRPESRKKVHEFRLIGSARNNETVKGKTTKVNWYLYRASSGQQGGGSWKKGKGIVWKGKFVWKRIVREEIDSHRVSACQGDRWLILLLRLVAGTRYRGFLVGRRMTGLCAWWFGNDGT